MLPSARRKKARPGAPRPEQNSKSVNQATPTVEIRESRSNCKGRLKSAAGGDFGGARCRGRTARKFAEALQASRKAAKMPEQPVGFEPTT